MGAKSKRAKISPSKVPTVLFVSVAEKDLERAISRGQLRAAKGEAFALFAKRRSAKSVNGKRVVLDVAARAAAKAGVEFYEGPKASFEARKIPLWFVGCSRPPKAVKSMERIDAAGGVVIMGGSRPRVLLLRKGDDESGRWVLPKGKRRPSEARREAARREVLEETGLAKVNVKRFLIRENYFDLEGRRLIFKEVSYYLMRCPKGRSKIRANRDEGFSRGSWVSFDTAFSVTSPVRAHRTLRKAQAGLKEA